MRNKPIFGRGDTFECPTCDSTQGRTDVVQHKFTYGVGDTAVELTCQLPVRVCENCGGQFVDEVGEAVRQEAICRHLNRLTPTQVLKIREDCGSQVVFGELTGIGEASLSRWETGASMPSKAYDRYLYLLMFPENLHRLQARAALVRPDPAVPRHQFQCIQITESRLLRQRCFALRRTA